MATADAPQASKQPDADPPADDRPLDPTEEFRRPPDEDFWEKYSGRLEMPLSGTASVLFHVLMAVLFLFGLPFLMGLGGDRSAIPVKIMEVGGDDDEGEGSAGSGNTLDPIQEGNNNLFEQAVNPTLADPSIPQPKDTNPKTVIDDAGALASDEVAKALSDAKKNNTTKAQGSQKGLGGGQGRGTSGQQGTGPGGYGNDGKWKRGLNWSLRFSFEDTREYTRQLASVGAAVLVTDEPKGKTGTLYADMNNPKVGRPGGIDDPLLSGRTGFYEQDAKKIRNLIEYLGAGTDARSYGVFFPKKFMDELGEKERAYRNRQPEDIERTVFGFVNRGGKYDVVVLEQTPKR